MVTISGGTLTVTSGNDDISGFSAAEIAGVTQINFASIWNIVTGKFEERKLVLSADRVDFLSHVTINGHEAIQDEGACIIKIDANGASALNLSSLKFNEFWQEMDNYSYERIFVVADESLVSLTFTGSSSGESVYGGDAADTLDGRAGDDALSGSKGNDTLLGSEGSDTLNGGEGADTLNGGDGLDIASYSIARYEPGIPIYDLTLDLRYQDSGRRVIDDELTNIEGLEGDAGNDYIAGNDGANVLIGLAGNDTIWGLGGNDLLFGGDGYDNPSLGPYSGDWMFGGNGNDLVSGESGIDHLYGEDGDDTLNGGEGADNLYGGTGLDIASYRDEKTGLYLDLRYEDASSAQMKDDYLFSIEGLEGGSGNDFIVGLDDRSALVGGAGNDTLYGLGGNDFLFGEKGSDFIYGGDGADRVDGNEGNDVINGDVGNDTINGGDGSDYIEGGAGIDYMTGGKGVDYFYGCYDLSFATFDVISDFSPASSGEADVLVLGSWQREVTYFGEVPGYAYALVPTGFLYHAIYVANISAATLAAQVWYV
jgi:Ca2+-binding RTX toxin-like protein